MAPAVADPAPESVLALDPLESIDRLLPDLRTRRSGLSDREAARRPVAFGPNELVRRRGCGWLGELVQQLVYPLKVHMIRDSIPRLIEVRELVPGDVIMVEEGDRLSADARLLTGSVEMDVSMLTAESLPVLREADPFDPHGPILEALDMVFSGTNCTEGDATAVVLGPRRLWARLGASSRQPGNS